MDSVPVRRLIWAASDAGGVLRYTTSMVGVPAVRPAKRLAALLRVMMAFAPKMARAVSATASVCAPMRMVLPAET